MQKQPDSSGDDHEDDDLDESTPPVVGLMREAHRQLICTPDLDFWGRPTGAGKGVDG